jgi:Ca2+-transporting ATPase
LFQIGVTSNLPLLLAVIFSALLQVLIVVAPWGQEIFKTTPLTIDQWEITAGCSLVPFVLMELWKAVRRRGDGRRRLSG